MTIDDAKEFARLAVAVAVPVIGLLRERIKLDIVHAQKRASERNVTVRSVFRKRWYQALNRKAVRAALKEDPT